MTINELLSKARKDAEGKTFDFYLDIFDGNEAKAKAEIESDKLTGEYQKELDRHTMDNIHTLIRTIRKSVLLNDAEKEQAVAEIKKCPEYQATEKRIAMLFANHFVKYQDIYLR